MQSTKNLRSQLGELRKRKAYGQQMTTPEIAGKTVAGGRAVVPIDEVIADLVARLASQGGGADNAGAATAEGVGICC